MDYSLVRLQKFVRIVEVCILVLFFVWLSTQLPFAVRISGEYCRRFSTVLVSPASIFLLGNAIVISLLAKSGTFTFSSDNVVSELYDELRSEFSGEVPGGEDEIVYQDKEIICEETIKLAISKAVEYSSEEQQEEVFEVKGSYQRSKSAKVKSTIDKEKLRRSETDICRREELPEDDEDFRRTIEAFIAKQLRFHREESLAVVLHGQA